MKKNVLGIVFLLFPFLTYSQFAPESDPHRGIYIDVFLEMNNSNTAVDTARSMLSVDADHDGIFEKEDAFLRYVCQNHITYVAIYDTHRILGRNRTAWNENTKQYENLEKHLCRFIQKAKSEYGVTQIGAIGGSPNYFDSLGTYMDRFPLSAPVHLDSSIVNNPHFSERLRIVERQFSGPTDEAQKAELLKFSLDVLNFNSTNACEASIDVINVEYEFWFNCQVEFANFYDILVSMNSLKQIYNSSHPDHQLITEAYLAQMYFCNGAINQNNAVQAMDGCSNCAPIPGTTSPHAPLLDRALYSVLQNNPFNFPWSEFNSFQLSNTQDSSDFHPMFYSECQQFGGSFDYMGSWMAQSPLNTMFVAENYFFYHFLNYSGSPLGTPRQNDVQAGGAHWFAGSYMEGHYDDPPVIQPTGTYCTSTGDARITLLYCGPNEIGIDYDFYITRDSDQSIVYPASGSAISGTSVSSIPNPGLPSINLNDTTIFPPMILPSGEYTAHLDMRYDHSTGCSYPSTCKVSIGSQPKIQVIGDTTFCEGNHTFLVAPAGGTYLWQRNGITIPGETSAMLKVMKDGDYTCDISGISCSGLSNSLHITVYPNPNVWISSHCNGNGTITLRTNFEPYTTSSTTTIGPNGATYNWETGATTDQITIPIPTSAAENYSVIVTNPYSGCSVERSQRIPVNPDSLTANLYVISSPSSPCSNDGSIGAELLPSSAVTGQVNYLWSNGAITQSISNVPAGTYSCVMSVLKNACSSIGTITLGVPPSNPPTISSIISNASCSNSNDGSIDLNITGGNPPFTFEWEGIPHANGNDPYVADQSNLFPGKYRLHVLDANGCSYQFVYIVPASHTAGRVNITSTTAVSGCGTGSNGAATVSATGGNSPYIYLWIDPANQTGSTANNLAGGTYDVIATDASGCTASASVHIPVVNLQITTDLLDSSVSSVNCSGTNSGELYVDISGGVAPYTVNAPWVINNSIASRTNLTPGNYSLVVTDNTGCSQTSSFQVTQSTSLQLNALSALSRTEICNGSNDGVVYYLISGGDQPYSANSGWTISGDTAFNSAMAAGTYTLSVTDVNGCANSQQFSVTEDGPVGSLLSASTTTLICPGISDGTLYVKITSGSPPYSVQSPWLMSNDTAILSNLSSGNYSLSVTDNNNCSFVSQFTILPSTYSVNTSRTGTSCIGCSDGTIDVQITNGQPPFIITYNPVTGSLSGTTIVGLVAGLYEICVTDSNSCIICVNDSVPEDPSDIQTIDGTTVTLFPNPTTGQFTIESELLSLSSSIVRIFDLQGKLIVERGGSFLAGKIKLMEKLSSGIYFIEIGNSESKSVKLKLIVL